MDLEKLANKIFDLYREVNEGKDPRDEKDMKQAMTVLFRVILGNRERHLEAEVPDQEGEGRPPAADF